MYPCHQYIIILTYLAKSICVIIKLMAKVDTNENKLGDYEPGATQAQVQKVLKKVAKAKPCDKPT